MAVVWFFVRSNKVFWFFREVVVWWVFFLDCIRGAQKKKNEKRKCDRGECLV